MSLAETRLPWKGEFGRDGVYDVVVVSICAEDAQQLLRTADADPEAALRER
ncbi:MAG: hypothetical protein KA756_01835 [Steroidobacteraceae bacterium]|jgi:hypothetical protein|nr:hypothetical protein [Steroidobacteraceae bacterium]